MKLLIAIAFLAVANGMPANGIPEAVRLPEPALPQFETSLPVKEAVRVVDVPENAGVSFETVKVVNTFEGIQEEADKSIPQVVNVVDVADEGYIDNAKIDPSELESLRVAIAENMRNFLHQVKYTKPYLRSVPQMEDILPVKEAVKVFDASEISDAPVEAVNVVNAFEGIPEEAVNSRPEVNPEAVRVVDVADEGSIDNAKIAPSELESLRVVFAENMRDLLQIKYNKPYLRSVPQMEDILPVKEAVKVVDASEISDAPVEAVNVVNAFEGIPEEAVKSRPEVNPETVRVIDVAVEDSIDKVKIVETPLGTIKLAPSELESIRILLPDNIHNFARDLVMNVDQ